MIMMKNKDYVMNLGQFLKFANYVSSGGEAKHMIHTFEIYVNGEKENRRGKKLYSGDEISIDGDVYTLAYEDTVD